MSAHDSDKNLIRLCNHLMTEMSVSQIAEICREIAFDPDAGGVHLTSPLTPPFAVYFVHSLHIAGKLGEFLTACAGHYIDLGNDVLEFPIDTSIWEPRELPSDVIRLLNERLGVESKPHVVAEWDSVARKQQLVATGCMCWDAFHGIRDSEFVDTERIRILDEVRGWLSGMNAFAYIGMLIVPYEQHFTELIQIVVAPTMDPLDAIRIEQTGNVNADIETPDLLDELERIGRRFDIDVYGASSYMIALRVRLRSPQDVGDLRAWLDDYAPNGYELYPHHLFGGADPLMFAIRLWWD